MRYEGNAYDSVASQANITVPTELQGSSSWAPGTLSEEHKPQHERLVSTNSIKQMHDDIQPTNTIKDSNVSYECVIKRPSA